MTEEGPVMNRRWLVEMKGLFPNSLSRILLACDDGTERTDIAADFLNEEGYSAVQAIDGGIDAYLEEFPLEEKDKIVWKMSDADRSGPVHYDCDGQGFEMHFDSCRWGLETDVDDLGLPR